MCGISFYLSDNQDQPLANYNCQPRGPDTTTLFHSKIGENQYFSLIFHRLAIVDTTHRLSQPFEDNGLIWVVNGEIFNYKELIQKYNLFMNTHSDCEVVGKLYSLLGLSSMLEELDGDFAFIIVDTKSNQIVFGRDRIGVRPLFYNLSNTSLSISSEMKGLFHSTEPLPCLPGHGYVYSVQSNSIVSDCTYFKISTKEVFTQSPSLTQVLTNAVEKRLHCTEQPIGFLLSGGLDSSLILSIACKLTGNRVLDAFTIGMKDENSPDVESAKKVVQYLNESYGFEKVRHTIFEFTKEEGLHVLPEVIRVLESYDVTTVRASVPMYLLVKKIKETLPKLRVLFSGEGADELFGGYLYFFFAPSDQEFRNETKRLVENLHYYDVCRADRCVSSHGLELRVPFLDKYVIEKVFSLPPNLCRPIKNKQIEKKILRQAFEDGYLPNDVLWRTKAAFSDAVGYKWFDVVHDWCQSIYIPPYNQPSKLFSETVEEKVFLFYYNKYFQKSILPDLWVPNRHWIDTKGESSARILQESL